MIGSWQQSKVLNIINSLGVGGAENQLLHFLINAKEVHNYVMDVAVLYGNNVYADRLRKKGVEVIELRAKRKYNITVLLKIFRLIQKNKYNIVFAQLFPTIFYVAFISLFLPKTKYIVRETSTFTRRRKYLLLKLLDRFIYSRYTKIVCVDREIERSLTEWVPGAKTKTVVLNKGIQIPCLQKRKKVKYDLIFVGRLVNAKGVDVLLDSLVLLKPNIITKKVAIVGDGPLKMRLKRRAVQLSISSMVEFLGPRDDVTALLQQSRIFVLPSRWEGTPSALLEAMSISMPVIATKVGGVIHVIESGIDGILIPPDNSKILAQKIKILLQDKRLAFKLGAHARKQVLRKYTIARYTHQLLALFDSILQMNTY